MFKYFLYIISLTLCLYSTSIDTTIKQRNLFEKQKEVFHEKEKQKEERILYYNVQKPKTEDVGGNECFTINKIEEEGFTLLSSSDKSQVYRKYLGRCNALTDIKNLINEITFLYIDKGFITSKVYLKSQNISDEIIILHAIEGKIEEIHSENIYSKNVFLDFENSYLNLRDLEVGIENINRLNSNNAKLNLKPGTQIGLTIVDIENETSNPLNGYITYNNFGSNPTGKHQFGFNANFDNPLGFNDLFSINYNTTNEHNTQNNSIGDAYRYSFPIGRLLYMLSYSKSKYKQIIPANFNEFDMDES